MGYPVDPAVRKDSRPARHLDPCVAEHCCLPPANVTMKVVDVRFRKDRQTCHTRKLLVLVVVEFCLQSPFPLSRNHNPKHLGLRESRCCTLGLLKSELCEHPRCCTCLNSQARFRDLSERSVLPLLHPQPVHHLPPHRKHLSPKLLLE